MTSDDRAALMGRLDFLAGEVIYSGRHLLEQPYRVTGGETLETIGKTLNVPWQLLGTINRVNSPASVVPGQELKVVRGPFRAEVNLGRSELTLFLGELYAGRFSMTTGQDPSPEPGEFSIQDRQTARTYYPLNGANIPAGDPRNPYGDVWLDLGNRVCIHGSATTPTSSGAGCIQLTPRDAKDVFGILSKGSSVSIIR
jgi:lipoprotein-anchoring transpeptidase ErfK/SrfK